jgi:hypothetical protein
VCPHTAVYVCLYCCVCVRILLDVCPHTATCVVILLYTCPHTGTYVCVYCYVRVLIRFKSGLMWYISSGRIICLQTAGHLAASRCLVCVPMLLCMCPHTGTYVCEYCYVCVLTLLHMCPHAAMYLAAPMLRYMRLHTAMYVSSYRVYCEALCDHPHAAKRPSVFVRLY